MMISILVLLAVILQAPLAIHALSCLTCRQNLNLTAGTPIVIPDAACTAVVDAVTCKAMLRLTYYSRTGSAGFSGDNDTGLILTNGDQLVTQRTMIRLNTDQFERSIEFNCYKNAWCVNGTSASFANANNLKYQELRDELRALLYNAVAPAADLVCANGNNQPIACRNGFCQLTSSDTGSVAQTCVNRAPDLNSWGVNIQSRLNGKLNEDATFTYTCNRPTCNNISTGSSVEALLIKYELVTNRNIGLETTTTTTTTTGANPSPSISANSTTTRPNASSAKPSAAGRMAYSNLIGIHAVAILAILSLCNM